MRKFINLCEAVEPLAEDIQAPLAVGYHRTRNIENTKTIGETGFKIGSKAMYGKGIYLTYDFDDQQDERMKNTYGPFIVRAKVRLSGMLVFDPTVAQRLYGIKCIDGDSFRPIDMLRPQFEQFGLTGPAPQKFLADMQGDSEEPITMRMTDMTSGMALRFYRQCGRQTKGLVFTGAQDGRVIVAYDPAAVVPFSWARVIDLNRDANTVKWNKFANPLAIAKAAVAAPVKVFQYAASYFKRLGFTELPADKNKIPSDGGRLVRKFGEDEIILDVEYFKLFEQQPYDGELRIEAYVSRDKSGARFYTKKVKIVEINKELPKILGAVIKQILSLYNDMGARAEANEKFAKELITMLLDDAAYDGRQLKLFDQPGLIKGPDYEFDKIELRAGPILLEMRSPYDGTAHGYVNVRCGDKYKLRMVFNDGSGHGGRPSLEAAYRMLLDTTDNVRLVLKLGTLPDVLSKRFRDDLLAIAKK